MFYYVGPSVASLSYNAPSTAQSLPSAGGSSIPFGARQVCCTAHLPVIRTCPVSSATRSVSLRSGERRTWCSGREESGLHALQDYTVFTSLEVSKQSSETLLWHTLKCSGSAPNEWKARKQLCGLMLLAKKTFTHSNI